MCQPRTKDEEQMNQEQYDRAKEANKQFVAREVRGIALDQLKVDHRIGQARESGHSNSHVEGLVADIGNRGQQVPITVEAFDGEGYLTIDGILLFIFNT